MKKIFTFIAVTLFAVAASADVIWSESLDKNGSYINKADFGNNWPYATQWYDAGNFIYAYDSVGSYGCSVRNKKLNGDSENSIGFFFSKDKAADVNYLHLEGQDGAIVEGAVNCKLIFDVCSSETNGGDLSTMKILVNGVEFPALDLALGNKLITSEVSFDLANGDIKTLHIAFDNVPAQKFIANLRIEGEAGTAHGTGGVIPPVVELDTISATEAYARAQELAENTQSEKLVVDCYVASIKTAYSEEYGNITVWLNDDPTSTYGNIQAYRASCTAEVGNALQAGDHVFVTGRLAHSTYESGGETKHSYQIAQGAELVMAGAPQGIENITLGEKAQKVMIDGVVYIVRDNKLFNLQGAQVR